MKKDIKLLAILPMIFMLAACSGVNFRNKVGNFVYERSTKNESRSAYHFMNGNLLYQDGKLAEAAHEYALALKYDSDASYIMARLGTVKLQTGEIDEAENLADMALTADPKSYEGLLLEADVLMQRGKEDAAMLSYKKAIEIDPKDDQLIFRVADREFKRDNLTSAEEILRIGVKNHSYSPVMHYMLGTVLKLNGKPDEAEKTFKAALELNPQHQGILSALSELYEETGKVKEAADVYEQIVGIYPANQEARMKLQDLLVASKQYDKAMKNLQDGLKYGMSDMDYRLGIALLSMERGDNKRALEEFQKLRKEYPFSAYLTFYIGASLYKSGDKQASLVEYSNIPMESPLFPDATLRRALILDELGRSDEAIAILTEGYRNSPKRADIALILVEMLRKNKSYDDAIKVASLALNIEPENTNLLFAAATVHGAKGDTSQALDMMKYILKLDPEHALAMNYLGYSYAEKGENLDEAEALIVRALEIRPEDPYILDSLGWVQYQKGDYSNALATLKKASALLPDDPTINEHLGDAYRKKGQKKLALESYNKALKLKPEAKQAAEINKKINQLKRGK